LLRLEKTLKIIKFNRNLTILPYYHTNSREVRRNQALLG